MTSQEEITEIEKISENPSETTNTNDETANEEINSETSSKNSKKKRPVSEAFRNSIKKNAPVFFREKQKSEGTFKENFRKSATDMWKDVKTVFGRKSIKEDSKPEKSKDDESKGVVTEEVKETEEIDNNGLKEN